MSEHEPSEFTASPSHWLVRAYYTPLGDALVGRLSARLDVRSEIAAAGLPAVLANLILQVVRRTRLWRAERVDVARELVAHFSDGLAAGRTSEQLTADFGEPARAAQLIRKAKIRSRGLSWHVARYLVRGSLLTLLICAVAYGALAARFYLGQPQIAHNFLHEANAARRVPDDERAWPLYRTAAIKLGKGGLPGDVNDWTKEGPGGEHWIDLVAAVDRYRESLDLIRQGAKKPRLGTLLGDPADRQAAREALPNFTMLSDSAPVADDNPMFPTIILDYVQVLRELARLLAADVLVAADAGQSDRTAEDLHAMLAMSEQLHQPQVFLVEQLVGVAVFGLAMHTTGQILDEYPQLLSDGQLRDLAHGIAAYRGGNLSFDLSLEATGFKDVLQRIYTDDGQGDGRVTPDGIRLLRELNTSFDPMMEAIGRSDRAIEAAAYLLAPGLAMMVGGRRENQELYDSLCAEAARAHQGPPWLWNGQAVLAPSDRIHALEQQPISQLRFMPTLIMAPAMMGVYNAVERQTQVRDAMTVAIALALWHRRHGTWPSRLDELVPDLLPAVPADRIDGQPLRYALRDGKPVLYSIGVDRDDDGGRQARGEGGTPPIHFGQFTPEALKKLQGPNKDGDWVLWPPEKED